MAEESSKKAMSLNQLHSRNLTASHSKSTAYGFLSEMKNRERQEENDGPSFNITDFDLTSSPETHTKIMNEDKIFSMGRSDDCEASVSHDKPNITGLDYSSSETKSRERQEENDAPSFNITNFDSPYSPETLKKTVNNKKYSSMCQSDDSVASASHDKPGIIGLGHSCSEKVLSKVMNEDELRSAKQDNSSASIGEHVNFTVDDLNCQHAGDGHQKVKIHGRRRLCKVVVKDNEEEDDQFHDVETNFSAAVSEFDSPSPVENTGNNQDGGDEIRDILSDLSARFEILSIKKGKHPDKQLSSSSDLDLNENFNKQKPIQISDHLVGKAVSSESFIQPQENKNVMDNDGDDDDCVVTSGHKFVQKAGGRHVKSGQKFNDSKVYTLHDESNHSTSEDEVPLSLTNPKFSFSLPSKIANMLYPHQREGLKWLWSLHCKGKGGILGDDMGLGKTMQICGFLAGLFNSNLIKRVLVVAPKTLLPHWLKELGVVNLSGITREYFGTCSKARQYELQYILQDKGVLLTTYDIVRNNVKSLSGDYDEIEEDAVTWDYMILDEGHLIKNPSTQRAKSLLAIPCAHRIIISGTPLQNNLKELWALFNFCCPELLGDKKCFKDKYESAILRGNDKNASDRDKRIGSAVAQDLRNCIQPYFLRRLKNEVFRGDGGTNTAKLSKKNEIIVWLRLSSCQRQLYEAFLNSEIVLSAFDGSPLAALTILKKICDHPLLLTKRAAEDVLEGMETVLNQEDHGVAEKLAMHIADVADRYDIGENHDSLSCKTSFIISLLDNLIPEGHHVLIFSQTRKMLNLIQDTLNARGYKFLRIDGTTKASDRLKIVNDFQEGVGAPIFLLTSQVGGLGLTLTKADRVIVVDPAWNPSTDNQSVDRAYRIGQKKDVIVYRLMTCGTVEEKIYRKQIYKGGLFRSATEHKEQIRYFSQQDLRELFSLPKQGFDVSPTQQQLLEEHDCEHKMDSSLKAHTKFLESLGIAGISHHSLLFSKTAPVPVVQDEELTRIRQSTYVGNSSSRSSHEQNVDAAQFAFDPKDVVRKKNSSPSISNKLTESEIKQQINRLSQIYANKIMVERLADKGEKIQKQIAELNSELRKLHMSKTTGETETIDLDDFVDDFNTVLNV